MRPERSSGPRRSGPIELVELEISAIAPGGAGIAHVARDDGRRVVFVPRAAPGDVLQAEVDFSEKPARGSVLKVLKASPHRAEMPCAWADRCGGCALMHLAPSAQLEAHRNIVGAVLGRALTTAGGSATVPTLTVHAAPHALGYRSRARFAVATGRGRVSVGYRRPESRIIEPIASCAVLDARLDAVLAPLSTLFAKEKGEGEVSVALGAGARLVLDVRWQGALSGHFFAFLSSQVEGGAWAGAETWTEGVKKPARLGDPRAVTTGGDGAPLIVPSGGFAQAHPVMNATLSERVLALSSLADSKPSEVVELFAGSGNFTVLLARHTESLLAVESQPSAVEAARENLRARGLSARIVQADADGFEVPKGARTVVLDPPRTGAALAAGRLARSKVRRVVYVSCDPSTLARDVSTLAAHGFRLSVVELFEMFPHTSHVETLAVLERPRDGAARGVSA